MVSRMPSNKNEKRNEDIVPESFIIFVGIQPKNYYEKKV